MTLGHIFKVSTSIGVIGVKQIILSTYSYRQQIVEYIKGRLEESSIKEYKPSIKIDEKGETTFITCALPVEIPKLKETRYFKENIIMPVAKAMVDIIEKEFAVDYANEILQTSYGCKEITITAIVEDKVQTKKLLDPIMSAMTENNTFCLDGWIRFRLSAYKMYMIEMVDNLIYEYEAYQEYEDFIALIKSYVLNQPSVIRKLHIIPDDHGVIELYNERKEYMELDMGGYECRDDLILGTILTLAPLKMMIHKEEECKNTMLIATIKSIYEGRMTFCKGCKDCGGLGFKAGFMRALKEILTQKKV